MMRLQRYVWRWRLNRKKFYQLQGLVYLGLFISFLILSSNCFYLSQHICQRSTTKDTSISPKEVVEASKGGMDRTKTSITTKQEQQSRMAKKFLGLGVSESERSIFDLLLRAFVQVVPSDVTYFTYGGTLLGSYRHHGMIPWDDDLDLLVRETDKERLLNVLQTLKPEFMVDTQNETIWKFFHKSSTPGRNNWGAWPFIDIFFFVENATHIWDTSHLDNDTYSKHVVFPLIKRPFMNLMIPAPRHIKDFLETTFDIEKCVTHSWSHKYQAHRIPYLATACQHLHGFFPFVHREYRGNRTIEVLKGNLKGESLVFTF